VKTGTSLVIALALSAGCWNQPGVTDENANEETLKLDSQTAENISGTYRKGRTSISLLSETDLLRGRVLIARPDRTEVITLSHDGPDVTISVLGKLSTGHGATNPDTTSMQRTGDAEAFKALILTPEFALLPPLSAALNQQGLTAEGSAAAKAIHDLAAHAGRMLQAASTAEVQRLALTHCIREICNPDEIFNTTTCSCELPDRPEDHGEAPPACNPRAYSDLRSDPCHDDCRGLCGPGCGGAPVSDECWKFVCGDCGYHAGCAVHDDMCGVCYDTFGLGWAACAICLTPIAVFVARIGC
jgi:hypothetical protein